MRVLVYVDSVYREVDGAVYSDVSFTSFAAKSGSTSVTTPTTSSALGASSTTTSSSTAP